MDDYYFIRNKDYYRRPLIEFLPAEILKLGLLEKRREFGELQKAKLEKNINGVSVLDAHGKILDGFVKLPDDLTLCFLTQPFNVGSGSLHPLIYDLQKEKTADKLSLSPICFGKKNKNQTYKNMNVYYPGQMVPNIEFSPETKESGELRDTMGYYSGRDLSKHIVKQVSETEYVKSPSEYIGLARHKNENISTTMAYKTMHLKDLVNGTSFIGKVTGVIVITSCRESETLSSFNHEVINRYETFINMLNYVFDQCKKLNVDTTEYKVKTKSSYDLFKYL